MLFLCIVCIMSFGIILNSCCASCYGKLQNIFFFGSQLTHLYNIKRRRINLILICIFERMSHSDWKGPRMLRFCAIVQFNASQMRLVDFRRQSCHLISRSDECAMSSKCYVWHFQQNAIRCLWLAKKSIYVCVCVDSTHKINSILVALLFFLQAPLFISRALVFVAWLETSKWRI